MSSIIAPQSAAEPKVTRSAAAYAPITANLLANTTHTGAVMQGDPGKVEGQTDLVAGERDPMWRRLGRICAPGK